MSDPIRLWLWRADGKSAGELVLQPDAERPVWITLTYSGCSHQDDITFDQDSSDGNMYREDT